MKQFRNKETGIKSPKGALTYVDLAKACLFFKPPGGFTAEEMYKRFRIIDRMNAPPDKLGKILLEDADVEKLKQCVESMRWEVMHHDVVEFNDYVRNGI